MRGLALFRLGCGRPWLRVRMAARAWYLRTLIRACEMDILQHQIDQQFAPAREALARQRRDELNVRLIDCERERGRTA